MGLVLFMVLLKHEGGDEGATGWIVLTVVLELVISVRCYDVIHFGYCGAGSVVVTRLLAFTKHLGIIR